MGDCLELEELASNLISKVTATGAIREGIVMSAGHEIPYRRLDCDGRALAYVKPRPRKRAVRVDVSALWVAPLAELARVRSVLGAAIMVRNAREADEVAAFLLRVVETTREAIRKQKSRSLRG